MSVNNDVFQVLVGNITTDATIANLSNGQIGCYNGETEAVVNLANALPSDLNKIYFAARNKSNDDLTMSPQFNIEIKRIKSVSAKQYFAGQNDIQYISGFNPDVSEKEVDLGKILTTYGLKIQANNTKLLKLLGIGAYTKAVFTDNICFDMSKTDGIFYTNGSLKTGTALLEAYKMYKKYAVIVMLEDIINKNGDDYFEAEVAAIVSNTITPAAYGAVSFNEKVEWLCSHDTDGYTLFIESKPLEKSNFSTINMHYYKDRFTSLNISLIEGFCYGATMVNHQYAESSVGEGYDVMNREYIAGGWNGRPGPYRTYSVTGLPQDGIYYNALPTDTFHLFSITYEIERIAGFLDHRSWVTVEIAVPSSATYNTVKGYFSKIATKAGVVINGD